MNPPDDDRLPALLTRAEVARVLRVSLRTVARYLAAGRLRPHKLGAAKQAAVRISREDVEALLRGER